MPDGSQHAVEEFAEWLRQMKLLGGDRSLRELEQRTESAHQRVARSTIQDALDAKRLPSIDQAVAMIRAMTGDEARVEECRRRWTAARSAVKGVAMPTVPAPATARQVPPSGTAGAASPVSGRPTVWPPSAPETAPEPHPRPPATGRKRTGRWRGKRTVIAAVVVAVSAAVGGGVYLLQAGGSGGSSRSPRAQAKVQDGYTLVYRGKPAATAGSDSSIDLTTGTVAAEGPWMLSSYGGGDSKGAFDVQDATDAALSAQSSPTPAQCLTSIAERQLAKVSFALAPAGTTFCLRWKLDGDIAVVHVLDLDTGNWAIKVSLDYYRRADGSSAAGSTAPSASEAGYTAAYRDRPSELRSSDDDIDLTTGGRTTDEHTWYLSSNAGGDRRGAFELAPGTDAFVAGATRPGPVTCARQIERHRPATAPDKVRFPAVPVGHWFCLRSRATGGIAVVRVVDVDTGDWGAKVVLSYFRPKPA